MGPVIVTLIRLLIPLTILKHPFWGTILSLLTDAIDVILITILNMGDFTNYHSVDKFLDMYYLSFSAYTSLAWNDLLAKKTSIFLFVYRLIGFILFELTHMRSLLLLFPNLFEHFFLFYLGYMKLFKKSSFSTYKQLAGVLIFLLILKLPQELVLHYLELQPWNWFKETVLGL